PEWLRALKALCERQDMQTKRDILAAGLKEAGFTVYCSASRTARIGCGASPIGWSGGRCRAVGRACGAGGEWFCPPAPIRRTPG
ncbi:hypothetical protein ABZ372_13300, partial [Streptomyces sp. NPDC005921]